MATLHERASSSSSPHPRFIHLPYELVNNIAAFLTRQDFINFRLSSRIVSACTTPLLALTCFDGVPWRTDGKRLHELSHIPSCARRIRSVKFNMARMVEEEVEYATSRFINADELNRRWGSYLMTQDVFLGPIELPLDLVIPALKRLPNLNTICLTWTHCPWDDHFDISDVFDREKSLEMASNEIYDTQDAVLEALLQRNTPMKSLTIEPFLHTELTIPSGLKANVSTVLGSVTQLHLEVQYEIVLFEPKRLDDWISLMPNLRDLRVHSCPVNNPAPDIDFFITKRLKNLEKLDLSCLQFNFVNFSRLIANHASTLKEVRLESLWGWCDPFSAEEIDWDMMFQLMNKKLEVLEKVRINGTFSDNVGWHQLFFHGDLIWAEALARIMGEISEPLETFILKGGEYPRPRWII
ncbi:hypothetical protein HG530_009889 [Fusarium avenaceum]|nr:hypothetical protein HG530_009889 [Fusarium avenaceum]